jgi:triacylglycerol lipase
MPRLSRLLVPVALLSWVAAAGCSADVDDDVASGDDELVFAPPHGDEPRGMPTRHPIVLEHGFMGAADARSIWSFNGVKDALERDGHTVHESSVPPFNSAAVRARELAKHVRLAQAECRLKKGCDASRVHVIAHSFGGLDAREYISVLAPRDHAVFSLTTISSPHRGTNLADVGLAALRTIDENTPMDGRARETLDWIASTFAGTFTSAELAKNTDLRAALLDLAEANAERFNAAHPDDPNVVYQSWAGVSGSKLGTGIHNPQDNIDCEGTLQTYRNRRDFTDGLLKIPALVAGHGTQSRPNDGMATVLSAKWGRFMGCIPADHLDEVGQPGHSGPNKWTGFDHLRFYRNVAYGLAKLEQAPPR